MRIRPLAVWLTLTSFLVAAPVARAQQHVVDSSALQQALADARTADAANRTAVQRVLARPDVQQMAARLGVDVKKAETALAVMTGDELAQAAQAAHTVESDLAGGDTTITISLTALLVILLIVLLVAD